MILLFFSLFVKKGYQPIHIWGFPITLCVDPGFDRSLAYPDIEMLSLKDNLSHKNNKQRLR